jgi:hypothetical protein
MNHHQSSVISHQSSLRYQEAINLRKTHHHSSSIQHSTFAAQQYITSQRPKQHALPTYHCCAEFEAFEEQHLRRSGGGDAKIKA